MDSIASSTKINEQGKDSDNASEDDRDVSPTRKFQKLRKRKSSMITIKDSARSKLSSLNRTSKGRQSLSQTAQEMSETFRFLKSLHSKSHHIYEITTNEYDEDQNPLNFNKLTLDDKDPNRRISLSDENESKNSQLEDRLDNENGLDITGIINLSAMNITDDDLPVIIQRAFNGGRKKCTGLILRDNFLTSLGVKMIVDAIISSRSMIKYLSFSNNPDVRDEGIEHIVRLLSQNRYITFVAIPNTNITDRSVRLLADVLCGIDPEATIPPLEKLYISFNKLITDESIPAILQIIEQNHTLKILSIENCGLTEQARKSLRQIVSKSKKKKFSLAD